MLEYIPLDLLTDKACQQVTQEPPPPDSFFVFANSKLHLPSASFDISKESKLSFNDWSAALDNLVGAMQVHLCAGSDGGSGSQVANAIADLFVAHFKWLKYCPNAWVKFNIIMDYDQRLHALFLRESFSFCMDTFYTDVWEEYVATMHAQRVSSLDHHLAEMESFLVWSKSAPAKSGSFSFLSVHFKCLSCGSLDHKLSSYCIAP